MALQKIDPRDRRGKVAAGEAASETLESKLLTAHAASTDDAEFDRGPDSPGGIRRDGMVRPFLRWFRTLSLVAVVGSIAGFGLGVFVGFGILGGSLDIDIKSLLAVATSVASFLESFIPLGR